MALICFLQALSDKTITAIADCGTHDWWIDHQAGLVYKPGFEMPTGLGKLFGRAPEAKPYCIAAFDRGGGEGKLFDTDKAWEGVHYIINDTRDVTPYPYGFLYSGGIELTGDRSSGAGPLRAFKAEQASEILEALRKLPHQILRSRFSPALFDEMQIYPYPADKLESGKTTYWRADDFDEYLFSTFRGICLFLENCVQRNLGFIIGIELGLSLVTDEDCTFVPSREDGLFKDQVELKWRGSEQ